EAGSVGPGMWSHLYESHIYSRHIPCRLARARLRPGPWRPAARITAAGNTGTGDARRTWRATALARGDGRRGRREELAEVPHDPDLRPRDPLYRDRRHTANPSRRRQG